MQIKRATRGKALRFNFGASIHRVVGFELADAVFEPGSTEIRIQWRPRISLLLEELQKAPAVLRLTYLADVEDAELVERRIEAVKSQITEGWAALNCCYRLSIERELFWRLGGPPKRSELPAAEAR
jgi:large repetitive protein